ncbi:siderophore ABC transporter substrate-binding protein [Janthinobacterium sp. BJB304]|uniref:siderophore ABC transporter substrate-binding protein n=1 Tax=Janthinobacterium sp. BJB304 TaxID=1572871 RepID=UPI000C101528|nr:siderophore ABC transporter substrate-binding protein [Janthinobacterium sp. BJB304]PHV39380.1 ferric anguibactin-binding protein [Janthinobacterium sp. BJB304]
MIWNKSRCALAVLLAAAAVLQGCTDKPSTPAPAPAASAPPQAFAPITIVHKLGTTVIDKRPQRVAVLDMNEVDFLDQLGVPVAGMVKDYVPHFLSRYKDDQGIRDLGAIVQPNLEHIHALQPDLVLMTSIQANHYKELSQIAPTLHFDVDYQNSESKHIDVVKQHLLILGRIFGKEDIASLKAQELDAKVAAARKVTQARPERALIVLHNNGAFSAFGVRSRYGFVFDALGVKTASSAIEAGLHGQPITSEFIQQANPDIIYVVDRTAVMEHRPVMTAKQMANPLLRQTNAWKNGRVVFVDADAWYITAASVTSLKRVIDDVLSAYE